MHFINHSEFKHIESVFYIIVFCYVLTILILNIGHEVYELYLCLCLRTRVLYFCATVG